VRRAVSLTFAGNIIETGTVSYQLAQCAGPAAGPTELLRSLVLQADRSK
jgi:hypothetical protein